MKSEGISVCRASWNVNLFLFWRIISWPNGFSNCCSCSCQIIFNFLHTTLFLSTKLKIKYIVRINIYIHTHTHIHIRAPDLKTYSFFMPDIVSTANTLNRRTLWWSRSRSRIRQRNQSWFGNMNGLVLCIKLVRCERRENIVLLVERR